MIKTVEGIGVENSKLFVENISKFIKFLAECNLLEKIERNDEKQETLIDKSHPLYNKKIVITGFRDKELTDDLIEKYNVGIANLHCEQGKWEKRDGIMGWKIYSGCRYEIQKF